VLRGLQDLANGEASPEAALVEIARSRLGELGLRVADRAPLARDAELRLYERLAARHPERDPYPLYCAWLDQLVSFLAALRQLRAG